MYRDVVAVLAILVGWLTSCLLAPYSLWRMIISPLTDVALTEYMLLHLVIGVVLLVGSLSSAVIVSQVAEAGLVMLIVPVSVLAMLLGLGLMAITQNLTVPSTFIPDIVMTIITGFVMIVSLVPYVISVVAALYLMYLLMGMILIYLPVNQN